MSEENISELLNRTLTSNEVKNFELYLKTAVERLEQLLCCKLCDDSGERIYQSQDGFRELYVDPFTDIDSVKIDDKEVEGYTVKQNEYFYGGWFNIIEFDEPMTGKRVTVDASWGFNCFPGDLQILIAKLFAQVSREPTDDNQVKSKKIVDFTVTYKDNPTYNEFVLANQSTINKYSRCNVGGIASGDVRTFYY